MFLMNDIMKNKKFFISVIICCLFLSLLLAGCIAPTEYMIPMRDGVNLTTDVYIKNTNIQHGVILIWTSYNKDELTLLGMNWAENG
jgi:predicted acyl esterase